MKIRLFIVLTPGAHAEALGIAVRGGLGITANVEGDQHKVGRVQFGASVNWRS